MENITYLIFLSLLGISFGVGGTQISKAEGEGDSSATESVEMLFIGHPLKLSCNMSNNDNVAFHLDWYKDGVKLTESDRLKIFQVNSSLVINFPQPSDVGPYSCEVANDTMSEKPHPKTFIVIFFELKKMPKSMSVTDQDKMELECPVNGRPFPHIIWQKDDEPIEDVINATRLSYTENDEGVPKAILIINKVEISDRGNYSCISTTLANSYLRFTFVRVKDIYAALWPFLGIVVEVLLLGIVIFIFERRREKAEFEESDTDQGNDQ